MSEWDGFLAPSDCKRCGKALSGQGTGTPAELYAGTYTGLCYACTDEAPYAEDRELLSDARAWSHPPSCPSWRREREIFYAFDDCPDCNHGRIHVSRSDPQGGPYGTQCPKCWERHMDHPAVREQTYKQKIGLWRHTIVTARAQLWYDQNTDGKTEDELKQIREDLIALIQECVDDHKKPPPDEWPSLLAPARKKILKRAPEGLNNADLIAALVFLNGNPRRKRNSKCTTTKS
jgi:hypothetical protein